MNAEQEKIFNVIAEEVVTIVLHWRYLQGIFIDEPFADELLKNKRQILDAASPMFFGFTFHLFYDHIFLKLSKLMDPAEQQSKENLSIKNLISKLEPLPSQISLDVKQTIDQIDSSINAGIKTHRNKRIAHNDLATKLNVGNLPRVKEQDFYTAVDSLVKLMNLLSKHYFGYERDFYNVGVPDFCAPSELLAILKRGTEKA